MYVFLCVRKEGEGEEGGRERESVCMCVCVYVERYANTRRFQCEILLREIKLDTNNWSNSFRELFLFNMPGSIVRDKC